MLSMPILLNQTVFAQPEQIINEIENEPSKSELGIFDDDLSTEVVLGYSSDQYRKT